MIDLVPPYESGFSIRAGTDESHWLLDMILPPVMIENLPRANQYE